MECHWKFFLDKFNLKFILKNPPSPSGPRSLDNGTIDRFKYRWQSAEHLFLHHPPTPPFSLLFRAHCYFSSSKKKRGVSLLGPLIDMKLDKKNTPEIFIFLKQKFVGRA